MFFGLEVKNSQQQAKPITLSNALKLSQAVLEPKGTNGKKEPVSVMVEYNKKTYILGVIDPNHGFNCPLDLYFENGSQVKFFIKGNGTVHLTGYEELDELDDMSISMSSGESENEEVDEYKVKPIKAKSPGGNSAHKTLAGKPKTNGIAKKSPKKPDQIELPDDTDSDDGDFDEEDDDDLSELSDDMSDDDDEEDNDDEEMDDDDDVELDSDDSSAEE